jgi:hypothetical protein
VRQADRLTSDEIRNLQQAQEDADVILRQHYKFGIIKPI